ncbi:MAG: [protein-PII] uridylyltransferase [Candidatus Aldehydirespiratoraceae bacterium]|jgi:[protein-PII] uridylyltransferase
MNAIPATSAVLADSSLIGTGLSRAYTAEIDAWLQSVVAGVGEVQGVALAAVGGYGRGDLSLGSDLDLLLIHNDSGHVAEVAERIWYPIWDTGMKLGHAVRTIDEAIDLATDDLDTATSLLDIRFIGGDERLVNDLAKRSRDLWHDQADKMLLLIAENTKERHAREGEVAFLLEPDLKLSRGGLRDVHALHWIDLADDDLVLDSEHAGLAGPHDTLLSARVELHRLTGRHSNQLLLQEQDDVAAALGFGDADDLMAEVASAARTVAWITDAVLHRMHQRANRRRWRSKVRDFGHGIQIIDETLTLLDDAPVSTDPVLPLRVALVAAQEEAFIEREVLDRMADHTPHLPDPWPDEAREVLVDLLLLGHDAIRTIEALDQVDLISRLIPEWAPNRSRPQRNAYHRFTVDRHLLEAAAEAAVIAHRVERPDLLVLGGLFHDIGKGYPGDHSEVGVDLVRRIGQRMGYPPADVEVLAAMVRHHLLLPDVASRRDLEDEDTIRFVAEEIDSVTTLELLAALTEADSIATSHSAWGGWKAELVGDLVRRTELYLQSGGNVIKAAFPSEENLARLLTGEEVVELDGHDLTVMTEDRRGTFSRVAGALALHGVEILEAQLHTENGRALEVLRVGGGIGLDERPKQVEEDVRRALRGRVAIRARLIQRARNYRYQRATAARLADPELIIDNELSSSYTVLEVRGPDSIGFLYRVTRAIADLDLDIYTAKVQTLGDDVVDSFYVLDSDGMKVTDPTHQKELELAILTAIAADA